MIYFEKYLKNKIVLFVLGHLYSCLDQMRQVLGDSVPEQVMVEAAHTCKFDPQKALDSVLTQETKQATKARSQDSVSVGKTTKAELFTSSKLGKCNLDVTCVLGKYVNRLDCKENRKWIFSSRFFKFFLYINYTVVCNMILIHSKKPYFVPQKYSKLPPFKTEKLNLDWEQERDCVTEQNPPVVLSLSDLISKNSSVAFFPTEKEQPAARSFGSTSLADLISNSESDSFTNFNSDSQTSIPNNYYLPVSTQNITVQNSMPVMNSTAYLPRSLGSLSLDEHAHQNQNRRSEFDDVTSIVLSCSTDSSTEDTLLLKSYGSPSLAELIREHSESYSQQHGPLSAVQSQTLLPFSTASLSLGSLSLSQLASEHQAKVKTPELPGSLSSLMAPEALIASELANLSLSDLLVENNKVVQSQVGADISMMNLDEIQPSFENDTVVDLRMLISSQGTAEEPKASLSKKTWGTKKLNSRMAKFSKGRTSAKCTRTISWTKDLSAKPSAFALTLCFHYPQVGVKKPALGVHKAFLYSRQIQDIKCKDQGPLLTIAPFDFKAPSPDDIVKTSQKRAFTRE
uniref:HBS1-like protein N-terminal domain-containing protein n=1 Tax=Latimeria chalumnae TaxID=7897 RepID=H2ZTL8_LATCH